MQGNSPLSSYIIENYLIKQPPKFQEIYQRTTGVSFCLYLIDETQDLIMLPCMQKKKKETLKTLKSPKSETILQAIRIEKHGDA